MVASFYKRSRPSLNDESKFNSEAGISSGFGVLKPFITN